MPEAALEHQPTMPRDGHLAARITTLADVPLDERHEMLDRFGAQAAFAEVLRRQGKGKSHRVASRPRVDGMPWGPSPVVRGSAAGCAPVSARAVTARGFGRTGTGKCASA